MNSIDNYIIMGLLIFKVLMGRGDWIQLGLSREIADVAIAQGFQEPMAVQKATIPLFISNKVKLQKLKTFVIVWGVLHNVLYHCLNPQ